MVQSEIIEGARILIVGRDPGEQEMRVGRPFVGPAGELLDRCLGLAGLQRGRDVSITNVVPVQPPGNVFARHPQHTVNTGLSALHSLIERTRPNVVVCLGNEAAFALLPDWPSSNGSIYGASGIQERRGYWSRPRPGGPAIVATLHPAGILRSGGRGAGAVDEMLLTYDLERAKEVAERGLQRPVRDVRIVSNDAEAAAAKAELLAAGWAACDIEIKGDQWLACVGFAARSDRAWVFTPPSFGAAFALLRNPALKLCFHNGQFDLYFLRTRCGVDVANYADDTIVAFHCCWPALAGKGVRGTGRTQKSLKFLSSIYTFDEWWKDYDFTDDSEMYRLNGVDCMVTFDIHERLKAERRVLGISNTIYRHELGLVWPCIHMLERGIRVDRAKLTANAAKLRTTVNDLAVRLEATAKPLLEEARERISNPKLFWTRRVCECCRNGKGKRDACWACAGFEKKPTKKQLGERVLAPCAVCGGAGASETFSFNFDSTDQKKILLYEVLGITPRYAEGRPSVSEDKLKEILGSL